MSTQEANEAKEAEEAKEAPKVSPKAQEKEKEKEEEEEEEEEASFDDLFQEPPDYYPPTPPPTTEQHALGRSGVHLTLHLVGHSVLEAHRLWNGSRVLADYLEAEETERVRGRTVLELGAGAGLPGIVCGLVLGAQRSVVTDYPDPDLVATIQKNIDAAGAGEMVVADGFVWGGDPDKMRAHLIGLPGLGDPENRNQPTGFDILLLADLLFRHAEHGKLAASVAALLRRDVPWSRAYVFFTSYRPWLRHKDLAFFGCARDVGLVVEHLLEKRYDDRPPLFFEGDPGDVGVRSTVSGYQLRWPVEGEDPAAFWPPPGGIPGEEEHEAGENQNWKRN